jgi:hypothetical protein
MRGVGDRRVAIAAQPKGSSVVDSTYLTATNVRICRTPGRCARATLEIDASR